MKPKLPYSVRFVRVLLKQLIRYMNPYMSEEDRIELQAW